MRCVLKILPLLSLCFKFTLGGIDPCDEPRPANGGYELMSYLEFSLTCIDWKVYVRISACKMKNIGVRSCDEMFVGSDPNANFDQIPDNCKFDRVISPTYGDIFNATFNYDECDAMISDALETYNSHEYRLNLNLGGSPEGSITRSQQGLIFFACWYNMNPERFLAEIHPQSQSYQIAQIIDGGFSGEVFLKGFLDSNLKKEITAAVPFVTVPDFMYILAEITGGRGSGMILQAEACWATRTSNPADASRYDLIVGGCPESTLLATYAIAVTENYISWRVVFGMRSFLWVGFSEKQEIYIHCTLHICDSSMNSDCTSNTCDSGRKRRGLSIKGSTLSHASLPPVSFSVLANPMCAPGKNSSDQCEQICTVVNAARRCLCYSGNTLQDDGISCKGLAVQEEVDDHPLVVVVEKAKTARFNAQQMLVAGFISLVILHVTFYGAYLYFVYRRTKMATDFTKDSNLYERLDA